MARLDSQFPGNRKDPRAEETTRVLSGPRRHCSGIDTHDLEEANRDYVRSVMDRDPRDFIER